ncbi:MAG: glycerate 2-kinase [Granulosicoccus sp.]|jgi:hydroxypyruvate reductase
MTSDSRAWLLRKLFQAGVNAVSGYEATRRVLMEEELPDRVYLVALGKAADSMARGALSVIDDRLVSGLVVTKHCHLSDELDTDTRLTCIESGHPVPDDASLQAGLELKKFVQSVPSDHLLIFLVSGGTSALVEALNDGLGLIELKEETDKLLASGAPIGEMNRHRRTMSQIKGGKLAKYVSCEVLQLLISDVPGDKLADIGSGLLVPDATTGMSADLPVWKRIKTSIIASSAIAQAAVKAAAIQQGLVVQQGSGNLHGNMPEVIDRVSGLLNAGNAPKGVYIWGGEPTIVLPSKPGRGGRNQHLALALAQSMAAHKNASLLVCGTDGTDGPTDDAGGLVSQATFEAAVRANLKIEGYLQGADAGSCLDALGCLVTTGPTGTNVMDLAIAILD